MIQNKDTEVESQESLSDFWREHKSDRIEEELSNVLDAARGYLGFFGSDFSVDWGKESAMVADKHKVILDYTSLDGKTPPYNGIDVDKVMGDAIHECGHIKWSYPQGNVTKLHERLYYGRGQAKRHPIAAYPASQGSNELRHIANILEDFYVENKVSETYPTLGAYLRETRKANALSQKLPQKIIDDLATDKPAFDSLVAIWAGICLLDNQIPANSSAVTKSCLNDLIHRTMKATKATEKKRLSITREIWEELDKFKRAYEKEQEKQEKMMQQQQQGEGEQSADKGDEESAPESEEGQEPKAQEGEQGAEKPQEEPEELEEQTEGEQESKGQQEEQEEQGEGQQDEETKGQQGGEESKPSEDEGQQDKEQGDISEETTEDEPYPSLDELSEVYSMPTEAEKTYLPADLKQAVDEYQEKRPVDLTDEVASIVGGTAGEQVRMELAGANPALAKKYRTDTYKTALKLSRIFQFDKRLRTRYSRGLQEGAVDARRLAKAGAADYKLFERKEVLSTPDLAVTVLVDMSSSMDNRVSQVMPMAAALKTAFDTIPNINLNVMAYAGVYGYGRFGGSFTALYRIYDRSSGGVRPDVYPRGGTPSGYAIAGAASQMMKTLHGKDKLLVHITDGQPDTYDEVSKAVEYCNQNNIDVMTLTVAIMPDKANKAYHQLIEQIHSFEDLPDSISKLLKRRLQKQLLKIR